MLIPYKFNEYFKSCTYYWICRFYRFIFGKKILFEGFKVFGVDNLNDYYEIELKYDELKQIDNYAKINKRTWKFFKASIEDKNYMETIFKDCKPDIVVNLAAQAGVRYSIKIQKHMLSQI